MPLHLSDPDVLPGQTDVAAPDGPNNEINTGYLWNNALRAGLTVRNYGFFVDITRYSTPTNAIPVVRNPFATGTMSGRPFERGPRPVHRSLLPRFRQRDAGFLPVLRNGQREFDANYANGGLPALTLVRFMHDHTGNFIAGPGGYPPPRSTA